MKKTLVLTIFCSVTLLGMQANNTEQLLKKLQELHVKLGKPEHGADARGLQYISETPPAFIKSLQQQITAGKNIKDAKLRPFEDDSGPLFVELVRYDDCYEIVECMLNFGANPDQGSYESLGEGGGIYISALGNAVEADSLRIAQLLLERGAQRILPEEQRIITWTPERDAKIILLQRYGAKLENIWANYGPPREES